MAQKVYVGDTGTIIRFRFSSAETFPDGPYTAKIKYRKPSGQTGEWGGTVTLNPDPAYAAYVDYTTLADDLDEAGTWWLQAYISGASWTGHSNSVKLTVYDLFE